MTDIALLFFDRERKMALDLAYLAKLSPQLITRHDFPDGEMKLRLHANLPYRAVLLHTLDHPNEKLIELLLAAKTTRQLGVHHLTLVAPYLAYMRQDIAFEAGEAVSQRIVGDLIASLFDAVITVDPHLHRIANLEAVIPIQQTIALSAAPLLGGLAAKKRHNPLLIGPDEESAQWVAQAGLSNGLDYAVARKIRRGDKSVDIILPLINVKDRHVVILDDIGSSGHTLARTAERLYAAGAATVDVAVTHALFNGDAIEIITQAGIQEIWSTDCIVHPSNMVSVLPDIAEALVSLSRLVK
jgi:ribose-phosphate pyrophosphokinase